MSIMGNIGMAKALTAFAPGYQEGVDTQTARNTLAQNSRYQRAMQNAQLAQMHAARGQAISDATSIGGMDLNAAKGLVPQEDPRAAQDPAYQDKPTVNASIDQAADSGQADTQAEGAQAANNIPAQGTTLASFTSALDPQNLDANDARAQGVDLPIPDAGGGVAVPMGMSGQTFAAGASENSPKTASRGIVVKPTGPAMAAPAVPGRAAAPSITTALDNPKVMTSMGISGSWRDHRDMANASLGVMTTLQNQIKDVLQQRQALDPNDPDYAQKQATMDYQLQGLAGRFKDAQGSFQASAINSHKAQREETALDNFNILCTQGPQKAADYLEKHGGPQELIDFYRASKMSDDGQIISPNGMVTNADGKPEQTYRVWDPRTRDPRWTGKEALDFMKNEHSNATKIAMGNIKSDWEIGRARLMANASLDAADIRANAARDSARYRSPQQIQTIKIVQDLDKRLAAAQASGDSVAMAALNKQIQQVLSYQGTNTVGGAMAVLPAQTKAKVEVKGAKPGAAAKPLKPGQSSPEGPRVTKIDDN